MEIPYLMNCLIITALLILFGLMLVPFYFMSKESAVQPGISRLILTPGYRRYALFVPESYTEDQPVPLILALHYAGHGTPYFGELFLTGLIEPAFRELGAIMVAPDCPALDWTMPKSEQFILDLLVDLTARFNLDPERILITGYSLGGIGTWFYAARFPDKFSAAIIMAARPPETYQITDWHRPLMLIHGRNDELIPLAATKEAAVWLDEQGFDVTLRILEGVTHYETHYFEGALRNSIPWLLKRWEK